MPGAVVDWRRCDAAHTAVIQVLLAARAQVLGPPRGEWLRSFVEPAIKASVTPRQHFTDSTGKNAMSAAVPKASGTA
jgi:hypothetical protein